MDLIKLLMDRLHVSEEQARGGAGLLFDFVRERVGDQQFETLSKMLPQVQAWIQEAPKQTAAGKAGGLLGVVTGLVSQLPLGQLGKFAGLASGFQKLGLDPQLISKYVTTITDFIQELGNEDLAAALKKVLSGK